MRLISNKFYRLVSVTLLCCTLAQAQAATDPIVTKPLKGSLNQIKVDSSSTATDINYITLKPLGMVLSTGVINNLVGVGIEEENTKYIQSNFTVTVHLQITKYDSTGTNVIETIADKAFTINYDTTTGAKYKSLNYFTFTNAYVVKVKIISIDSNVNWPVSQVLKVENQLTATRDYLFNCNLALGGLNVNLNAANAELVASWTPPSMTTNPNPGVTEYDLEWAWIDESALDNYKNSSGNYVPELIFNNNATRVSISGSLYNIPLLYDDTGKIFVRVRPVQLKTNGQRIEGVWAWQNNSQPVLYSYTGHEDSLNWQASTSFAEEGKRKSVVQYFDGSLRNRQTVTKDNTSNTTVVAESFYDYQGRPVIQVLPAPSLNTAIAFAHNFNQAINPTVNANEYPKWVYDKLAVGASVCGNAATPFSTVFGTANYYSDKNPQKNTGFNQYIPDATGGNANEAYAFTETRLTPDGRVAAQSGVGIKHQIGSGHETKYFYEPPAQEELDALFGTDAGVASHYFKNIVKDANGQYSISYTDMHGRTIATALAGDPPNNTATGLPMLEPLPGQLEVSFTKQLIDNETNQVIGNSIISSKPIVALKSGYFKFKYDLVSPQQLSLLNCNGNPVCYDCIYQFKIAVISDCGGVPKLLDSSKTFTLAQYLTTCTGNGNANGYSANQGFHYETPDSGLYLIEGSYTVTKTLTLLSDAQDKYRDIFLANDTCKKFIDFYNEEYAILLANSNCNITCESCNAAIGNSFDTFRIRFMQQAGMQVDDPISAQLMAQLRASYAEAKANCNRMCDNHDGLDATRSIRQMMLQDVTPPYGQYAKPKDSLNNYNIFQANDPTNPYEVFQNNTGKPDYKIPIDVDDDAITTGSYLDEFGQPELTGTELNNMGITAFVNEFKTPWANQLLVHHPEYKKLILTEGILKPTYQFEANLENDSTWAQAAVLAKSYITDLVNKDPFFTVIAPNPTAPGAAYKVDMINRLLHFYERQNSTSCTPHIVVTGSYISAWQVALGAVFCRDKAAPPDPCNLNNTDPNTIDGCLLAQPLQPPLEHPVTACPTDWDWAWKAYKNIYLTERRKEISRYLDADPQTHIFTNNTLTQNYQLRFIDYDNPANIYHNLGLDEAGSIGEVINTIGNNLNQGMALANTLATNGYDSACRGYANTWLAQLRGCPQVGTISTADSIWLVSRLLKICKTGSDMGHPLGSASVKPGDPPVYMTGSNVPYREFPDVVREFLATRIDPQNPNNPPNIIQPYTAECFPWLISVPAPYDKQPALANSYVLTKPSNCECQNLSNLKFEYDQSVQNGFVGTFSTYMRFKHGTYITQETLETLLALCNNTYTCKLLPKPISLPPVLQCRGDSLPPKACINCQEYHDIKTEFHTIFGLNAPVMVPVTAQDVTLNYAFARFANYKTGFVKRWTEYVAFEKTCNDSIPAISCGSLDSTLQDFFHSPGYIQNPVGNICKQLFVQFFNNHYNIVLSFEQWMAKFALCGPVPDICRPVITCSSFNALVDNYYTTYGVQVFKNANCQSLFVNFINAQLGSNYTYTQLEVIYNYVCGTGCGLNVCTFPNHFLLTKVYNAFMAANNGHPWELPNCQDAFVQYFNNYFGLVPALTYAEIEAFYTNTRPDYGCIPDISGLCTPPYSCTVLARILSQFYITYNPVSQLPHCQDTFALFFNTHMGTNYTYAQIIALYHRICLVTAAVVCEVKADCPSMIALVTEFTNLYPPYTMSGAACRSLFLQYFNNHFGTSYTDFKDLVNLYDKCGFILNMCQGCTGELVTTDAALDDFLAGFYLKYPDPATQLEGDCENVFTANFNSEFKVAFTFTQIEDYYWVQRQIHINVCQSQCSRLINFIADFNSRYSSLKLPTGAREDLFTFEYNKAFVHSSGGGSTDGQFIDGGATVIYSSSTGLESTDSYTFNPVINFAQLQNLIDNCGITGFTLAPITPVSIYDPQVLLSLKQVYYVLHPDGMPENCQGDFAGWFNAVMQKQYSYSNLFNLYNSICGNDAGYICEAKPDVTAAYEVTSVGVKLAGETNSFTIPNLPPMLCGLNQPAGGPVYVNEDPCKDLPKFAYNSALIKYELYLDSLRNVFDTAYYNKCMAAKNLESFTVTYNSNEYHYTLYYYDQAGNLVKTVPPVGVDDKHGNTGFLQDVKQKRQNVKNGQPETSNILTPSHTLVTEYRYNTLNQVIVQKTPDAGISNFWYDRLGRLVVSQNSKQKNQNKYSYTLFDEIGRPKEVGQLTDSTVLTQTTTQSETALSTWLANKPADQITKTFYDKTYFNGTDILCPLFLCQQNLRNRVSFIAVYATGTPGNTTVGDHTAATYYSYNIHGSVDSLLQDYNSGVMKTTGNRFKKLVYDFDLVSGKVNSVSYQAGKVDAFYHRYSYDAENRITNVETSNDKIVWERDARYNYYKHGPLARTELGQNQVQGIDYAYTLQGQLKGINSTSVGDGSFDMGQDGKLGSSNANIARDVYGISLNYFNGDYKPINNTVTPFASITVGNDLFNGNIKAQVVNIPKLGDPIIYAYGYDQLNRLTKMDAYNGLNNASNTFTAIAINDYKERLSYDPNGNIKTYLRNGTGATINLNNYSYTYTAGTNKLASITNAVNAQTKNYAYDEIGNTTTDGMQGMTNAVWNPYGKLQTATNKDAANITYTYAPDGQRISKTVGAITECYVKDATGNTMATYKKDAAINNNDLTATGFYKYGSSLVGIKDAKINVEHIAASNGTTTFERGNDNYILIDGNGNTRVTIKDTRTQVADPANPLLVLYYTANISTATFSSTYGANAKTFNGGFEAANFNGQRKSLEIGSDAQTAEFWEYNGDVGRRNNLDPKPNISESPYAAFENNPIWFTDALGDTGRIGTGTENVVKTGGKEYKKEDLVKSLVTDWSKQTGLKLSVDAKTGELKNGGVSTNKGVSMKARNEILNLMSSTDNIFIDFSSTSSETLANGGALDNKIIALNPAEIDAQISGTSKDLNSKTFGYGMTAMHELWHTTLHGSAGHNAATLSNYGIIDAPDVFGNEVRNELSAATKSNWGARLSYAAPYVKGVYYFPLTAKSKAALQPVYDQMIKVITRKQQWVNSGYSQSFYDKFAKELDILNKMTLPTKGIVGAHEKKGDIPPF